MYECGWLRTPQLRATSASCCLLQAKCCALLMRENTDGKTLVGLMLEDPAGGDDIADVWIKLLGMPKPLRGFTVPRWLVAVIPDGSCERWPDNIILELLGDAAVRPQGGFEGFSLDHGKQYQLATPDGRVELHDCHLRPEEGVVISGYVRSSHTLNRLGLRNNLLGDEGIDDIFNAASENALCGLSSVDIANNGLTPTAASCIADKLPLMRALTDLNLSGNAIGDTGMTIVGDTLLHNSGRCRLKFLTCDAFALGVGVTALDLTNSGMNLPSSLMLAGCLKFNTTLKMLTLADNPAVCDEGTTVLASALKMNSSTVLASLDLKGCNVSSAGVEELGSLLVDMQGRGSLKHLNLAHNLPCNVNQHGRGQYDAKGIKALMKTVASPNSTLTSLDLSSNHLSGDWPHKHSAAAHAIADALRTSPLQHLWLAHNDLGDEGVLLITGAAKVRKGAEGELEAALATLDVNSNKLGPKAAHGLAEMVVGVTTLTHLDTRGNGLVTGISGEGVRHLADAVLGSPSMEWFGMIAIREIRENKIAKLNLDNQGLGPVEGLVLSSLVGASTHITHISLAGNELGNHGVGLIADAAFANKKSKLQGINVAGNGVGQWGAQRITELVAKVSTITDVNVGGNFLDDKAKSALGKAPHNPSLKVMY